MRPDLKPRLANAGCITLLFAATIVAALLFDHFLKVST